MKAIDIQGSLYSSAGLRFGGFPTQQFLEATEQLEYIKPGTRDQIIKEAHFTVQWLHKFPEVGFLIGVLWTKSILLALLIALGCYIFELFRAGFVFNSPISAVACQLWQFLKIPSYFLAAWILWPTSIWLSSWLIGFLIFQGWLSLLTTIMFSPFRIIFATFLLRRFGDGNPHIHNFEANAVAHIIQRLERQTVLQREMPAETETDWEEMPPSWDENLPNFLDTPETRAQKIAKLPPDVAAKFRPIAPKRKSAPAPTASEAIPEWGHPEEYPTSEKLREFLNKEKNSPAKAEK